MRVLVLTYETPSYPGGGGASRQHCLLEPLAERHQVRVLSTGGAPRFGRLPAGVDLELIDPGDPVEDHGPWLRKNVRHYAGGRPWLHLLAEHHRRALSERVPDELETFRPDVAVVQHGELASLLALIPRGVARVLELHNMLLAVQVQQLGVRGPWERVKAALEIPIMARWERRDLLASTVAVAASEADRRLAQRLAHAARVEVVPNCVDAGYFAPAGADAATRPAETIIFTASFQYPPNQDAARVLLAEVLPRVRRERPGAQLLLAGQQMPEWLVELVAATDGAAAAADVADLRGLLAEASIALAPLRTGSGSPLKAIEALAAGVPVVASRRVAGALAIDARDGLTVADGADETARAVIRLLESEPARLAAGRAGRLRVLRSFDRRVVAPLFEQVLVEALARSRLS